MHCQPLQVRETGYKGWGPHLPVHFAPLVSRAIRNPLHDPISAIHEWICPMSKHSIPGDVGTRSLGAGSATDGQTCGMQMQGVSGELTT